MTIQKSKNRIFMGIAALLLLVLVLGSTADQIGLWVTNPPYKVTTRVRKALMSAV